MPIRLLPVEDETGPVSGHRCDPDRQLVDAALRYGSLERAAKIYHERS